MALTKPLAVIAIGGVGAAENFFNGAVMMRPKLREQPVAVRLIGRTFRARIIENFVEGRSMPPPNLFLQPVAMFLIGSLRIAERAERGPEAEPIDIGLMGSCLPHGHWFSVRDALLGVKNLVKGIGGNLFAAALRDGFEPLLQRMQGGDVFVTGRQLIVDERAKVRRDGDTHFGEVLPHLARGLGKKVLRRLRHGGGVEIEGKG